MSKDEPKVLISLSEAKRRGIKNCKTVKIADDYNPIVAGGKKIVKDIVTGLFILIFAIALLVVALLGP